MADTAADEAAIEAAVQGLPEWARENAYTRGCKEGPAAAACEGHGVCAV